MSEDKAYSSIRLDFSKTVLPKIQVTKQRGGFWEFGVNNLFPEYVIDLYNKSARHAAIVNQKAAFLSGQGTEILSQNTVTAAKLESFFKSVNGYESWDKLKKKKSIDAEMFDAYYIEVIWNMAKTGIAKMSHVPFQRIRQKTDGDYLYSEDWTDTKYKPITIKRFNSVTREGKQLFEFRFYRVGTNHYPLPSYASALKYIDIDCEIANYHWNGIKSGFTAQTLIEFFKGEPTPEVLRDFKRRFIDKYTTTDNTGQVIIQFNDSNEQGAKISSLQAGDFDKMYLELEKAVEQNILTGHRVTSGMLFGIKSEGQLGGRSELIEAYEAFLNSYVLPRQQEIDESDSYLLNFVAEGSDVRTMPMQPIGIDWQLMFEKGLATLDEARINLGLGQNESQGTIVDSINNLSPLVANKVINQMTINEIRSIAGLKPIDGGDEISLPEVAKTFSQDNEFGWDDERDIAVFSTFGESADDYEKFEFASDRGNVILQTLGNNKGLSVADIINITKIDAAIAAREVEILIEDGLIEVFDGAIEATKKGIDELKKSGIDTELVVRYEYAKAAGVSGTEIISTSRDFCRRLIALNRLYSRQDIDQISAIVGYDAFKRRGGWITVKGTNTHLPYCRHIWQSKLVRRKIQ